MSEKTSLIELRRFEPKSPLASDDEAIRQGALSTLVRGLEPQNRPMRRAVADMLSVVLALSARTKRMVLPRIAIDVDVFGPDGKRAVRLYMPQAE